MTMQQFKTVLCKCNAKLVQYSFRKSPARAKDFRQLV